MVALLPVHRNIDDGIVRLARSAASGRRQVAQLWIERTVLKADGVQAIVDKGRILQLEGAAQFSIYAVATIVPEDTIADGSAGNPDLETATIKEVVVPSMLHGHVIE